MSGTATALPARKAKSSDEYVAEIVAAQKRLEQKTGSTKPTVAQKRARLKNIMSDKANYLQKLGQGMVGPIQLRLRYQGITRNVLREDPAEQGVPVEYDVLDEKGQAYILHGNEGEVRVTPFEGKKVPVRWFRVATFPQIKKEDLSHMRVDVVEHAQDESKQAIMRQEDARLVTLLEAAIEHYGNSPLNEQGETAVNELSGQLSSDALYDLVTIFDQREIPAKRLLANPAEWRDIYKWQVNETGWKFKDDTVAGEEIRHYGEFQILRSNAIPPGSTYITGEQGWVGVMPVRYSLDVEENPTPAKFHKGWVMDEMISMIILNPGAVGKLEKTGS